MKKSLLLTLFLLCCFIVNSCGNKVVKMKLPIYSVSEVSPLITSDQPKVMMYEIFTPTKYNAAQLSLIASEIRKNTDIEYTDLWISYYVEKGDFAHYAESHISTEEAYTKFETEEKEEPDAPSIPETYAEPEPEETSAAAPRSTASNNGETVGTFYDQFGVYTIYKSDGTYYMENKFSDGSVTKQVLETRTRNNKLTFNVVGDPYEFFLIQNGNLYIYDGDGNLGLVYKGF